MILEFLKMVMCIVYFFKNSFRSLIRVSKGLDQIRTDRGGGGEEGGGGGVDSERWDGQFTKPHFFPG